MSISTNTDARNSNINNFIAFKIQLKMESEIISEFRAALGVCYCSYFVGVWTYIQFSLKNSEKKCSEI